MFNFIEFFDVEGVVYPMFMCQQCGRAILQAEEAVIGYYPDTEATPDLRPRQAIVLHQGNCERDWNAHYGEMPARFELHEAILDLARIAGVRLEESGGINASEEETAT